MPSWVLPLVQALPSILAAIDQLIKDIGGGVPTPAQAAQLAKLNRLAASAHDAMAEHFAG